MRALQRECALLWSLPSWPLADPEIVFLQHDNYVRLSLQTDLDIGSVPLSYFR